MSDPGEVNVEALLGGGIDVETLMAFADNDFEGIFEKLQEPFDDLEQRIVVSSMVQEAVSKGLLKAIEEEFNTRLNDKDVQISGLQESLKTKDSCIHDLQKVLGIAEDEAAAMGNAENTRSKQLWEFLQESQKKWVQSEVAIAAKEKEIERLSFNMARLTLMVDNESRRAATLEKQLNDLKGQDAIKSGQISSFQQDIVKLKLDKSSLNRQARLKSLQFDESMDRTRTELQQQQTLSENILKEKKLLEKNFEERNKAFSKLECEYTALETQMHILNHEVRDLGQAESKLREIIEEQTVINECEQELLMTCIYEQMYELHGDAKKYTDLTSSSSTHKAEEEDKSLSSITAQSKTGETVNNFTELKWKTDAEALIVEVVMDGWYKEIAEVLQKLTFELAWKDEEIFIRDGQLGSLKQAVEELENDYATLMSICLTLIRDQTDNDSRADSTSPSAHELGRRKLMELSEFLSSRDAMGEQEEKDFLHTEFEQELSDRQFLQDVKPEMVLEVFKEENELTLSNSRDYLADQNGVSSLQLDLASAKFQLELELEIACEIFSQKYKEAVDLFLESKLSENVSVENHDNKICDTFEGLGADLESFMELQACKRELEACRLEKIGCSTSIAKCEFKLDKLMKNLSDQVNKMNAKFSLMQDAIKLQELKHTFEEEILNLVIRDVLDDMQKNLLMTQTSQSCHVEHFANSEFHTNPLDKIVGTTSSHNALALIEKESQRLDSSQKKEGNQGSTEKDKMIALLRKAVEDLRKEKAECEQRLEEITEEVYRLKRQFWKEKEIWTSKLTQRQVKEVEAQVKALSRHSSKAVDLEEEFKKGEETRFDGLVSSLKKEWDGEKDNLTSIVSHNEERIRSLGTEISRLREKEREGKATEAGLLARIADLKVQADNLSSSKLKEEFNFAKCKQDWQSEKEMLKKEIDVLREKTLLHAESEASRSAQSTELENQLHGLSAQVADLNAEKNDLQNVIRDQKSATLKVQKQLEEERGSLLKLTSEKDHLMDRIAAFTEQEKSHTKLIEELKTERDELTKEAVDMKSSASNLTAENEIALATVVREKMEEQQKRRTLESQLQELRLEVKHPQDLNSNLAPLGGNSEAPPKQPQYEIAHQVEMFVKTCDCFEQEILQTIQKCSVRLDRVKERSNVSRTQWKKAPMMEAQQMQRLSKELVNLEKAEAEVDLLGDEVDSLLDILEEVHATFDMYAPVLVHYPKMRDVAKTVKQEIQLRIDPKYGA